MKTQKLKAHSALLAAAALLPVPVTARAAEAATATAPTTAPAMLPGRTLTCTLGRALNLDPSIIQTVADIQYEGAHHFVLHLPPAPQHQGPPPEPSADPEPVDPAVRVISDPDGIAADMQQPLFRVIDMWPERVELVGLVAPPVARFIAVSEIDAAGGTANLFTSLVQDAGSMDLARVYQGGCTVTTGPLPAQ